MRTLSPERRTLVRICNVRLCPERVEEQGLCAEHRRRWLGKYDGHPPRTFPSLSDLDELSQEDVEQMGES